MRDLVIADYIETKNTNDTRLSWLKGRPTLPMPDFDSMTDVELLREYKFLIARSSQAM